MNNIILLVRRTAEYWRLKQLCGSGCDAKETKQNVELWNNTFNIDYISAKHLFAENASTLYDQKFCITISDRGSKIEGQLGGLKLDKTLVYSTDEDEWISPELNNVLQELPSTDKLVVFKPIHLMNLSDKTTLRYATNHMLTNAKVFPISMCQPNKVVGYPFSQQTIDDGVRDGSIVEISDKLVPTCIKVTNVLSLTIIGKKYLTKEYMIRRVEKDREIFSKILNGDSIAGTDENASLIIRNHFKKQCMRYIEIMNMIKVK